MTKTDKTVAEVLNEAADLVEAGWVQGSMIRSYPVSKSACYCAAGAIVAAAGGDAYGAADGKRIPGVATQALKIIGKRVEPDFLTSRSTRDEVIEVVTHWNDSEFTRSHEVAWTLRQAAIEQRRKEGQP